jgi:hypothetical protein
LHEQGCHPEAGKTEIAHFAGRVTPTGRDLCNKADIARVQVPVITLELGREAALAVVCVARAGNGSQRAGLAAGVPRGDDARTT